MKLVKNIMVVACAASFMFAGVGFHMANSYGDLDSDATVTTSYGATWDLNGSTGIGYDSEMGMLMYFTVPAGVTLRMGWNGENQTSLGFGFTWWNGGEGVRTSLTTNFDYVMAPSSTDEAVQKTNTTNLSMVVGFGF